MNRYLFKNDLEKQSSMTVTELLKNKNQIEKKKVRKIKEKDENDIGMHSFMSMGGNTV